MILSSCYLCFRIPTKIRQLYAICHINEKATPQQYDLLCVSQTCHTKVGEQYFKLSIQKDGIVNL